MITNKLYKNITNIAQSSLFLGAGYFLALILAITGFWGCWSMCNTLWPGLHQDGAFFSTVAINLSNHIGNLFNVNSIGLILKQGSDDFNWHGQLYYPVISFIMPYENYKGFLFTLHSLNLISFCISIIVFFLLSRRLLKFNTLLAIFLGLGSAYSVVGLMHYLQGRPEHGIPLFLLLCLLIREIIPSHTLPNWFFGMAIGVVALISPLPGVLFAFFTTLAFLFNENPSRQVLLAILTRAIFAMLTWISVMLLIFPGSISEWIQNTLAAHETLYGLVDDVYPKFPFVDLDWFKKYWFTLHFAPGMGYVFGFAVLPVLLLSFKKLIFPTPVVQKIILLMCLLLPASYIWRSGFSGVPLNYSLICFFPFVSAWLIMLYDKAFGNKKSSVFNTLEITEASLPRTKSLLRVVFVAFLLFAVSYPGLGFARTVAMQPAIMKHGISYSTTLERYQKLKSGLEEDEFVLIDLYSNPQSAVVFDGPPWKMRTYEGFLDGPLEKIEEKLNFRGKYIFYLQAGGERPPERAGFKLIETNFNSNPVEIFGKTIRSTTPGYGYAIYERIESRASDSNSVQQVIKE